MNYNKPPLSIDEQIDLLISRGLKIPDLDNAKHYLKFINYYRLSGYTFSFEEPLETKRSHLFKENVTFDDVIALYNFDRHLRTHVMDAIEKIEVAVRTLICTTMAIKYKNSHWHLDQELFKDNFNYAAFINKCISEETSSKEPFVLHYRTKYKQPEHLPSWMIGELLPIGTWSILYKNLKHRSDKKMISDTFDLSHISFSSCLHTLTYIRNLCAHHSRLWNRHFTLKPMEIERIQEYLQPNTTFAAQAAIIHLFLKIISPESKWTSQLNELLNIHKFINPQRMGFSKNWQHDVFWEINP